MSYRELAPGIEGEEFLQYSPLTRDRYESYRIRTSAGHDCGVVFYRRLIVGGGWFIDQRSIGDAFIGPTHYPTPREAAIAAVGLALKRLTT